MRNALHGAFVLLLIVGCGDDGRDSAYDAALCDELARSTAPPCEEPAIDSAACVTFDAVAGTDAAPGCAGVLAMAFECELEAGGDATACVDCRELFDDVLDCIDAACECDFDVSDTCESPAAGCRSWEEADI